MNPLSPTPAGRSPLAAFVGVMVSFAAMVPYTFSLFLSPLEAAFGWKREAISSAFAITALTVAACSPTIGSLLDRLPPRRIILPSIVVFAAGMASLSLLGGNIAQFYGTYLLIGIVGNGTAQLAYSRAVLTWFERRRGLALAVVLTGSGTGSILLPPITQHVMFAHGWRASYVALGALALIGFPLTALLVRNRPNADTPHPAAAKPSVAPALRSRIFYLIALPILLGAFSMNAAIAHLAALLAIAGKVQADAKSVSVSDVQRARNEGATDLDLHDTVLIAAAFCMYNRYVDGLATWQPREPEMYRAMGQHLAAKGYAQSSQIHT